MTRPLMLTTALGLLAAALWAGGCGSYPAPTERMTTSEAAIRAAEEVGSSAIPQAALYLKLAQEQTEKARRLMQDGYNERAELTLKRAQADAELAIAISKKEQAEGKKREAQTKLEQAKAAAQKKGQ